MNSLDNTSSTPKDIYQPETRPAKEAPVVAGTNVEPEQPVRPKVLIDDLPPEQQIKEKAKLFLEYITDGLSESDCLILSDLDPEDLEQLKKDNPRFARVMARKKLEYKHSLIKTVTKAAKDDDSQTALRLLQSQFPEEFGIKRGPQEPTNAVALIISQIQGDHELRTLPPAIRAVRREEDTKQKKVRELISLPEVEYIEQDGPKTSIREKLMGSNSRFSTEDNPIMKKKRGRTRKIYNA